MYIRIFIVTLFATFTIGAAAQSEEVTLPKVGMRDTLVERLVRENVIENHGTPKEVVIENKEWTVNAPDGDPEYKYVSVYASYVDTTGKCWLIEYRVECIFNQATKKYDRPRCRGNGYGQGNEMKCD